MKTEIRPDIEKAIRDLYSDGIVQFSIDPHEGYLRNILDSLRTRLLAIPGALLVCEHAWEGILIWNEADKRKELDDDDDGLIWSYHMFYVGLPRHRIKTDVIAPEGDFDELLNEIDDDADSGDDDSDDMDDQSVAVENEIDDSARLQAISAFSTPGVVVGLSELAPFAIVRLESILDMANGDYSIPDLSWGIHSDKSSDVEIERICRNAMGDEAFVAAKELHDTIASCLQSFGVAVLPEEEASKPVPWLRVGDDAFIGNPFEPGPVKVEEAFFFHSVG